MAKAKMQEHFQSFNSALQNEVERVEAMRKEVESKEKALEEEKKGMMKIEVGEDDVMSLNIGGKIMAASRSTLCQVEGSLLASMFSGRWEERLKKDKHSNVFLDFNPGCFKLILNYLRAKKIETPQSKARKPSPPEEEKSNYWNLVDYLGLRNELDANSYCTRSAGKNPDDSKSCDDYYYRSEKHCNMANEISNDAEKYGCDTKSAQKSSDVGISIGRIQFPNRNGNKGCKSR